MSRSERVYRMFLLVYPREFRRDYGAGIVQAFGDLCREAKRRRGAPGLVIVWVRTVPDLACTAFAERSRTLRDRWLFMLVPLALALGFAIAYVDSGPGWDDTGVSAAAVLGVSGSFGLLYPARPWLWGLVMGAWIPAFGIVREFNYASLMALGSRLPALTRVPWCAGSLSPSGDPGWVRSKPRFPRCGSTECC